MKFIPTTLFLLLFCMNIFSQGSHDYAIQLSAEVVSSPPSITLSWKPIAGTQSYVIYKKKKLLNSWGSSIATVDGSITTYIDTDIDVRESYEYKLEKIGGHKAFGYINSGIEVPAVHSRDKILLLVDDYFSESLSVEIAQLVSDLTGDGWMVKRHDVSRMADVKDINQYIIDDYYTFDGLLKAVYILGHVPVPYSGNYAADGHPDHNGAWPADGFYGDLDYGWTDITVNNTTPSQSRNKNIPGDGKYDQSWFTSEIELQVGRVDFAKMNIFQQPEEDLLRKYLNKSHAFKHGLFQVNMQAVIDDNFGGFNGEAFAGAAYKSYSTLVHADNIHKGDYRSDMDSTSYIWSYGCGGGSFQSCSGVGTSADLVKDSLQGIFSSMFGSYFGDWDSANNILRATLAQGTVLTNCWNGRPHWFFHHMGMGENIGYSTRLSMNNNGTTYNTPLTFLAKLTSMGLMGDPSLRMFIVPPAKNLIASVSDYNNMELQWEASQDSNASYYVYRSEDSISYTLLNEDPITVPNFFDATIDATGDYMYMVRANRLETTASGSFYNLSQGVFSNTVSYILSDVFDINNDIDIDITISPNPGKDWFNILADKSLLNTDITIQNSLGQKIKSVVIPTNTSQIGFSLTGFSPGIYFVQFKQGNKRKVLKFVKQ